MSNFREHFTPSTITVNVADSCNLNCKYCFEHEKKQRILLPEDACKILDVSYAGFNENFPDLQHFMVNLFGGEPLIGWNTIKAMVEHKRKNKYKMRFGITTNLVLLNDEMLDYIEDEEIFLLVSIDGIKEVHDKNRNDSWDRVKANIKRLADRELLYLVEARMTILPEDAAHVFSGVKEIVDMGIHNIAPMPVTDVEWGEQDLSELRSQLDKLFDWCVELANDETNRKNVSIKLINDYIEHVLEPVLEEIEPCTAGTTKWVAIGTDGTIMPCHQRHTTDAYYEDLKIGNILTDEIDPAKIVNPIYAEARNNNECNACHAKAICRGGCPSENLTQTGSWYTPTKSWCKIQRMLIDFARSYHEKIMATSNLRVRRLNMLKANLIIKKFFDELCDIDIQSDEFKLKLRKFFSMMDDQKDAMLPMFEMYYANKLMPIMALTAAFNETVTEFEVNE